MVSLKGICRFTARIIATSKRIAQLKKKIVSSQQLESLLLSLRMYSLPVYLKTDPSRRGNFVGGSSGGNRQRVGIRSFAPVADTPMPYARAGS
jgi:hypothetical protein